MSYYPDTLKAILVYIEALDAADAKVAEIGSDGLPYLEKITLLENEGGHFGWLVDEIGGHWSWVPHSGQVEAAWGAAQSSGRELGTGGEAAA